MPPEKKNPPNRASGGGGQIQKRPDGILYTIAEDGLLVNLVPALTQWQTQLLALDRRHA